MAAYDKDIVLTVGLEPEDVISTAERLNGDIEKIFEKTKGKKLSTSFNTLKISMNQVIQKSQEVQKEMSTLAKQPVQTQEYAEMNEQLDAIRQKLEDARMRLQEFQTAGIKHGSAYEGVIEDIRKAEEERQEFLKMREEWLQNSSTGGFTLGYNSEEYQKLVQQLNDINI